ncbi:ferredoxin reductase [Luteibacter aegosomatissinici]|uniref:ferredoxin reductase n=1 Tax=Luteibacter aegosomatissinici TaxID=2911539 RepID=UPI001FFBFE1A|nr:ferredoxin reductase [Luteibacter aegosomatissinici]UPG96524.1 ferredoxin reductase [Luteibacter aegosomatissinici]
MNAAAPALKPRWPLRLARRAVSPALFDFWATRVNPLWTLEQPLARLVSRTAASRDAVTLVLRPNSHWKGMRAGQHVSIGVTIGGRRLIRSYSPTPLDDGTLAITVKAITGGVVSQHLAHEARIGDVVTLDPAFGDMTITADHESLLLLAAGSGITPMRALLRDLAARNMPVVVDLYYWARQRDEFCFVDELMELAAAHPRLHVHFLATRDGTAADPRIDAVSFEGIGPLDQRRVLACGPGGFVEAARARLDGQVASFAAEAFSLPATDASGDAGEVEVHLARSGRTLMLPRNLSVLAGLEAQGVRPPSGCRMGICNTCSCERQSGTTRHLLTGDLTSEPSSPVRLCVNAPGTDLILDL